MKISKVKWIETEEIVDVICDSCGASCNTEYGAEFMSLSANWGFFSNKDLEKWEAHICEKCVDEKLTFIKFDKRTAIGNIPLEEFKNKE